MKDIPTDAPLDKGWSEEELEKLATQGQEQGPTAPTAPPQPVVVGASVLPLLPIALAAIALIVLGGMGLIAWQLHRAQQQSMERFALTIQRLEERVREFPAKVEPPPPPKNEDTDAAELASAGHFEFRAERYQKAAEHYRAALQSANAEHLADELHYHLGICLLRQAASEEALGQFRTIVTNHPGSPWHARATIEMAEILMKGRNFAQARRLLYQVLANRDRLGPDERPSIEAASFAIARCYEGEAEAAAAQRSTATRLFSARPEGGGRN